MCTFLAPKVQDLATHVNECSNWRKTVGNETDKVVHVRYDPKQHALKPVVKRAAETVPKNGDQMQRENKDQVVMYPLPDPEPVLQTTHKTTIKESTPLHPKDLTTFQ